MSTPHDPLTTPPSPALPSPLQEITGQVERITFSSKDSGFTIARLKVTGFKDLVTIVGSLSSIQPGESLCCQGSWRNHPTYGKQLEVVTYQIQQPASVAAIQKYLESGLIRGVGKHFATKIVERFGLETLSILDEDPDQLREVEGLGERKLKMIKKSWQEHRVIREVMLFLQQYQITPAFAYKLYRAYGNQTVEKLQENPYRLAKEVHGIGFKTADALGKKMGIPEHSPIRINAGILYMLQELGNFGHTCYPRKLLIQSLVKEFEFPEDTVDQQIKQLVYEGDLIEAEFTLGQEFQKVIWSKPLYLAETAIAKDIHRLMRYRCSFEIPPLPALLEKVETKFGIKLAPTQKVAVEQALSNKVHIITGGPGTGKSTITRVILALLEEVTGSELGVSLAAPTGRAAKRLAEITGRSASTIHMLLEYDPNGRGFRHHRKNPLSCKFLILDETSMIDTLLMHHLLKALPKECHLILIGDINQLPSVGPGNVLKEIIQSQKVPTTFLSEIFRQASGSKIILNAHRINEGQFPDISGGAESDFFFLEEEDPDKVVDVILGLVSTRLPRKYQFNPFDGIQVLAPMKKGTLGINHLNEALQNVLNPNAEGLEHMGRQLRLGDKVIQIVNNYDKSVYNGDIGRIVGLDIDLGEITVLYEQKKVVYEGSELEEIALAYALSVHKYQGSEAPCIVMPIHTSHYVMLQRNLFYTAVTRGRKIVVLVGSKRAIMLAVQNDKVKERYSALQQALVEVSSFEGHSEQDSQAIPF
jgi:exodeoxyribonuclease V alpha subunit